MYSIKAEQFEQVISYIKELAKDTKRSRDEGNDFMEGFYFDVMLGAISTLEMLEVVNNDFREKMIDSTY